MAMDKPSTSSYNLTIINHNDVYSQSKNTEHFTVIPFFTFFLHIHLQGCVLRDCFFLSDSYFDAFGTIFSNIQSSCPSEFHSLPIHGDGQNPALVDIVYITHNSIQ